MERLTHERVNGIKTGYWSAATKEALVQKLAAYENTGYEPDEIRAAIEQARAQLATEALGGSGYKLVSLNLNSGGFQPVMPMRAMAMDRGSFSKSEAAPQIEAGTSRVSMSADGVIEVQLP